MKLPTKDQTTTFAKKVGWDVGMWASVGIITTIITVAIKLPVWAVVGLTITTPILIYSSIRVVIRSMLPMVLTKIAAAERKQKLADIKETLTQLANQVTRSVVIEDERVRAIDHSPIFIRVAEVLGRLRNGYSYQFRAFRMSGQLDENVKMWVLALIPALTEDDLPSEADSTDDTNEDGPLDRS
ncbi:MAG: hypothetical protein JNL96_00750 [Planctomycetaceae bacterium]|nr:hypothetical protein [Planctomycetaceae bacterium]